MSNLSPDLVKKYPEVTVTETQGRHFEHEFYCQRTGRSCVEASGGANAGKDGINALIPGGKGCDLCGVIRRSSVSLLGGEL